MRIKSLLIAAAGLLTVAAAAAMYLVSSRTSTSPHVEIPPQVTPRSHPVETAELALEQTAPDAAPMSPLHLLVPTASPVPPLELAIELLRDGALAAAQVRLEHISATSTGNIPETARLLWAACAEVAHDDLAAKTAYLQVAQSNTDRRLRHAAALGVARLQLKSGTPAAAVRQLQSELLQLDAALHPGDVLHLWAQALAEQERVGHQPLDSLHDSELESILPTIDLEQLLADIPSLQDPSDPPAKPYTECLLRTLAPGGESQVTLSGSAAPIRTVLEQLAALAGKRLSWAPATLAVVEGRTLRMSVSDLDLRLALDALLGPFGLSCDHQSQQWSIQFTSHNVVGPHVSTSGSAVADALQFALRQAPDHPLAPLTRLRLAQSAAGAGRLEAALHLYRELQPVLIDRGGVEVAFNVGKLNLRLGDRRAAAADFTRCVDLGADHPLQTAAYLYLGRVQLELGDPRAATAAFQRALLLARGTSQEPLARVLLASAWLVARDFPAVSVILSHVGAALTQSEFREAAAFVDALARYSAQTDPQMRTRDATHLLDALTRLQPEKLFGNHWELLADHAFDELGLAPGERSHSRLLPSSSSPLQVSAELERLERRLNLASLAQLKQIATELDAAPPHAAQHAIRLQLAQAEFRRGDRDAATARCQMLLQGDGLPDPLPRTALQLLGRIHQSRGEHAAALQCFVGLMPSPGAATVADAAAPRQTNFPASTHAD